MKDALRGKRSGELNTLRMLKSAIGYASEQGASAADASDDTVITTIRKEIKKRDDAIEGFTKAGRQEQAAQEAEEKTFLEKYLPEPLSAEEIESLVQSAIEETGATSKKEMGAVMKLVTSRSEGRADGRSLSQAVQKMLS